MKLAFTALVLLSFNAAHAQAQNTPAKTPWKVTLAGDEVPDKKPWTQPASISFTDSKSASKSTAIDAALRLDLPLNAVSPRFSESTSTVFTRFVVHSNDQLKKEQDTLVAQVGYHFELGNPKSDDPSPTPEKNAFQWDGDLLIGYSKKTIFPTDIGTCTTSPPPATCLKQYEKSLTYALTLQPFNSSWEKTFGLSDSSHTELIGPPWAHSFAPTLKVFSDNIIDAKLDSTGIKRDGAVNGAVLSFGAAFSPEFSDYRLNFRVNGQAMHAFSRSASRRDVFPQNTSLMKASIDYEFGKRSFEDGGGWNPSIGITYVKGSDPLTGLPEDQYTVIGLKVTYKAPG